MTTRDLEKAGKYVRVDNEILVEDGRVLNIVPRTVSSIVYVDEENGVFYRSIYDAVEGIWGEDVMKLRKPARYRYRRRK